MEKKTFKCEYTYDDGDHKEWTGACEYEDNENGTYNLVIEARGSLYYAVVGRCHTGNFFCIPSCNIGCSLARFEDVFYNRERLSNVINVTDAETIAQAIAACIKDK